MDRILAWFGEEEYRRRLARVMAFWQGAERYLVTVTSACQMYRQVFDDERILAMAPANLEHQARLPGVNLPSFFADFGTVSAPRYWGGRTRFASTGQNIFIDPVARNVEEALALRPRAVEDPQQDAYRALRLYRLLCERLETENLWLRMPDVQGPLNTAGMVVKQDELLMAMRTEPQQVQKLLQQITDFLISYVGYFHRETNGRACGFIWPYTFFPASLGMSFTEDLMPLLSQATYRQFGVPYLRAFAAAFGGLQIHCCGPFGRHAETLAESGIRILGIEFHYPFTRIEELECLADRTVFIPYIALDKQHQFSSVSHYYEHLLNSTDERHRYWFAFPEDTPEALAFAQAHGF